MFKKVIGFMLVLGLTNVVVLVDGRPSQYYNKNRNTLLRPTSFDVTNVNMIYN